MAQKNNRQDALRILAVDDEDQVLDLYKKIFDEKEEQGVQFRELSEMARGLFGEKNVGVSNSHSFKLDTCKQAEEAVQLVDDSIKQNMSYFAVFLDVRLPPGPDGVWAAKKIRLLDRQVNIIIVTAYSDVHPQEIADQLGSSNNLLYIQKPFYWQEIWQLARALSQNWLMVNKLLGIQEELATEVERQTESLRQANILLENEINERAITNMELEKKTEDLVSINNALKVVLDRRSKDREEIEESIMYNVRDRINPYIEKLKKSNLTDRQHSYVQVFESNINDLLSSFTKSLYSVHLKLTPSEIQVASFIKEGRTTKEISKTLNISDKTVETHRKNIRKKLGATNRKENLRTFLLSLE